MINLFSADSESYEGNGEAVLRPLSCVIEEEAGGGYELSMSYPQDEAGVWRLLTCGKIIKAPIPASRIESAISGENVDIYRATSKTSVYAKPEAPSSISYTSWTYAQSIWEQYDDQGITGYVNAGSKYTYSGVNYQLIHDISYQEGLAYTPPQLVVAGKAKTIASGTTGAAVLAALAKNEEFYIIKSYNNSWWYVQTQKGVIGYVQKSVTAYVRTMSADEIQPRELTHQLFRIYKTDASSKKRTVEVNARHVSYDLSGNMIRSLTLTAATAQVALARLNSALLEENENLIATAIEDSAGKYTGEFAWKNPVNALMDPDSGLVSYFGARLMRDNWDIFLMPEQENDRGISLSYGVNLRGVTVRRSAEKLVTRVIPSATNSNGSELLLDGSIYVDSPLRDAYPLIYTEYLKVDGKVGDEDAEGTPYTVATLRAHMREAALKRFSVDNADKLVSEIQVDFTLLGDTEEYKQYRGLEKILMYDTVRVYDPTLDLDEKLRVKAFSWDAVNERYDSVTLSNAAGGPSASVGGYSIVNGSIKLDKLSADAIAKLKS